MEGNFVDLLYLFDIVEFAAQFNAGKDLPAEIKKLSGVLVDFISFAEHLEIEERKRLGQIGPLKNRAEYSRVLNEIKVARDYYPGIMEVTPFDLRVASHALAAPRFTPLSPHYRVFQIMNMKFEEVWLHWEQQKVAWVEAHCPPVDPAPADPNNGPGPPGAGVPLALRPGKITVSDSGHAHQRFEERRAVPVETPARPSYARTVVSQTILRSNERLQFTRPNGNPVTPPRPASQRGGRSPASQATSRSSRLFLSGGAGRDQFSTGVSPKKRSGAPLESPNKRQG
ncbi:hypothetical protein MCOR33_008905 [Pyricularia grisea]|uniref:Uncharacterized protein n=1 Tax=Pyricularia grisea TaxID=148305 RepID=A0ABQ8NA36_PYRGI|nr:hypothetical protein MCOR33_008905 [Pyricularia grisea]